MEKINPLTKMITAICIGLSALIFPGYYFGLIILAFLIILALVGQCIKGLLNLLIKFGIPIYLMLIFIQGFYSPKNKTYILNLGFAKLGLEGFNYATKIVVVLLVFLSAFYLLNKTTKPSEMVAALTQSGINTTTGYLILASFNVVPQMHRQLDVIKEAQMARGVNINGSLWHRFKAYIPLMGPVVLSSLINAQERGLTLEVRGFTNQGKKTSLVIVKKDGLDRTVEIVSLLIFIAAIVFAILQKM